LSNAIRITLGEEQFRRLVAGNLIAINTAAGAQVHVMLADIGAKPMIAAIVDAIEGGRRPPDPPEAREFLPVKRPRR
jgi:hypothetical protein